MSNQSSFVIFFSDILIEAASSFAPQSAGLSVFPQERTGPIFGIAETVKPGLHEVQAGIKANEAGQGQRAMGGLA
jgi:hypothetical protein